ncbi:unnamed protein product, partial [Chrysoparadoxa australica]
QSRVTYSAQGGAMEDVCMLEGSHSIATGSRNGSIHIWRVEM